MKSLEIVNALLATMKIADNIDLNDCEEYFEKIKQDLEVLEILRKKLVDVDFLKNVLRAFSPEKVLDYYNNSCLSSRELTRREYLKVKQWLEENDE